MLGDGQIGNQLRVKIIYIISFADMDGLNNCGWNSCGWNSCGWCRGAGGGIGLG